MSTELFENTELVLNFGLFASAVKDYIITLRLLWCAKSRPSTPPYEAKLSSKNLTILAGSESEVFSSTAIAALRLSAVGLYLESRPTCIIDPN